MTISDLKKAIKELPDDMEINVDAHPNVGKPFTTKDVRWTIFQYQFYFTAGEVLK